MSLLNRVQQLPKGFVWGAATAAYQTEGSTKVAGKGKTMWDDYLVAQGRFLPDPASDFYNRYEEDIRLSAEHGLNAIRVSIAWTRIFPNGDDAEPLAEGVKHYHELFACCKKYGVEPYVSLHHFDSPAALFNQGDWLNRKTVDAYVRYAEFCFREFREVKNWFTINELISLSHSQYIQGNFPPNHHFDVTSGIQSQHNELVAHARAVNLYKDLDETEHLGGRIGMVNVLTPAYPATDSPADQHAADLYNAFYTDFIMDGAFLGHYSARTLSLINEILRANNATLTVEDSDMEELAKAAPRNDMFGLNYYQSAFIAAYDGESTNSFNGTGDKGTSCFKFKGVGQQVDMPGIPTTDWDWLIYPQGLYDTLKHISATYPNLPVIYITENGLGHKDPEPDANGIVADPERIDFVDQHMEKVLQARAEGVDVQGYFIWSLQDQFSWANGYNKRYGLFYIDFDTQNATSSSRHSGTRSSPTLWRTRSSASPRFPPRRERPYAIQTQPLPSLPLGPAPPAPGLLASGRPYRFSTSMPLRFHAKRSVNYGIDR